LNKKNGKQYLGLLAIETSLYQGEKFGKLAIKILVHISIFEII